MANNVYIGARYVPKFDGDYDNTKVYEPLTVVNYNGASYTSKRTVPANVLPTDQDYWAMTGNYNGMIIQLQNDVHDLDDEVDALEILVKEKKPTFYSPASYPEYTAHYPYPTGLNNPQGGCVLPDGKIVQYITNSDDSSSALLLFNANGGFIAASTANYGHGNDVIWSQSLNRLIVTGTPHTQLEVFILTGSSFSHERTISIPDNIQIHGLVQVDNIIYAYDMTTGNIYKTTDTFTQFELVKAAVIPTGADYLHQGLASDGDFLYWIAADEKQSSSVIFVFDFEGNYIDGWGYPYGWREVQWLDFYNGMAYTGWGNNDFSNIIIRKDHYRNNDLSYQPSQMFDGGKLSPVYVYVDSTETMEFKTGLRSDSAFDDSTLICVLIKGYNNVCIRQNPDNKILRLYDVNVEVRGAATLDDLYITRCQIVCNTDGLTVSNPATVLRSMIIGDITGDISNLNRSIIVGAVSGTLTGNHNVVTGAVTGTDNITP